jgi:hypothetical protein
MLKPSVVDTPRWSMMPEFEDTHHSGKRSVWVLKLVFGSVHFPSLQHVNVRELATLLRAATENRESGSMKIDTEKIDVRPDQDVIKLRANAEVTLTRDEARRLAAELSCH